MSAPQDYAALLEQNLRFIRGRAESLGRRDRLDADEIDDFTSWAILRLMEDDYASLRKFRGDAALTTYLTVVLAMLYRDFRVSRWGRWRPSAEARRRGPMAVKIERLVNRDGCSLSEALSILESQGETLPPERELAELRAALAAGPRKRLPPAGERELEHTPGNEHADAQVIAAETETERESVGRALRGAVADLSAEDRVIVSMRFEQGLTIAAISRALNVEQKPLYRRLERVLNRLRTALEAAGVSEDRIREMMRTDDE